MQILLYTKNSVTTEQARITFNKDGQPVTITDGVTGCTEFYTYNSLGNVTQRVYTDNSINTTFTEDFTYDDFGKIIDYTCNKTVDGNGELVSQYTYTYLDNAARDLESVSVDYSTNFKLKTDVFGRYTGKEIKNSYNTTIEDCTITYLEVNGTLTNSPATITYTNPNTNQSTTLAYTYDARGNIIEVRENGTLIEQYTYDTLNRLATEVNTKLNIDKTYTYDINGNLLNNGNYANDKFTGTDFSGVTYDQMGNITYLSAEELFWSKNKFAGTFNSYFDIHYDGLGRRHDKTHNRSGDFIKFIYDSQNRLLATTDGLTFIYDFTGVAGFKYNGNNYYYRKDILGNVIALLDDNGNIIAKYLYNAWGNHYVYDKDGYIIYDQTNVGHLNPFRYRGYFYDKETGLYYLNARYYSPGLCRFISPDIPKYLDPSTPNGLNLYTYCGNNPIMYIDPSGNFRKPFQNLYNILSLYIHLSSKFAEIKEKFSTMSLFGYEKRNSAGWDTSQCIATGWFGRVGSFSYVTHSQGQLGVLYAFTGKTADMMSKLDTTYYAGIGFNLFDIIGAEIQAETIGIGAKVSLMGYSLEININLLSTTSISIGHTTNLENGFSQTTGATIGINTGVLIFAVCCAFGIYNLGSPLPITI